MQIMELYRAHYITADQARALARRHSKRVAHLMTNARLRKAAQ